MSKCKKCLHSAKLKITGLNSKTLKIDIGGVNIYIMPQSNENIDVSVNSENLVEGDYFYAIWNKENWIIS